VPYKVVGGYTGDSTGYTGPGIPDVTRVKNPRQPDTSNYLATNFFKLEFTRLPTVTYFCQRVNLPSLTFSVAERGNPTGVIEKWMGGRYIFEDLAVAFQVDESMKNWLEVWEWMESISPMSVADKVIDGSITPDFFSDATIIITNSVYKPKFRVVFYDIFPTSLSGIDFDSTGSENEPVIATATFAYTHYRIFDWNETPTGHSDRTP